MTVYFFGAAEVGMVKIGYTWSLDVWGRLRTAQSNCPVELECLAVTDGGLDEERALHARFAQDRVRGEWYRLSEPVKAYIATLEAMPPKIDGRTTRWQRLPYLASTDPAPKSAAA